ncbi:hypothetical protein [Thauera humireducens]|uniref:hypothetical protein n=1 Tax=Thauera humireducens TaxID=1134435 RepID=UPI00311DDD88
MPAALSAAERAALSQAALQVALPDEVLSHLGALRTWQAERGNYVSDRRWVKLGQLLRTVAACEGRDSVSAWGSCLGTVLRGGRCERAGRDRRVAGGAPGRAGGLVATAIDAHRRGVRSPAERRACGQRPRLRRGWPAAFLRDRAGAGAGRGACGCDWRCQGWGGRAAHELFAPAPLRPIAHRRTHAPDRRTA